MRLEIHPGPWIVDLEQPKIDTLKGQDTLSFLLRLQPPSKQHHLSPRLQTFSSHLCSFLS